MAAHPSSSDYASNSTDENYSSNDTAGVRQRAVHEKSSSFMEPLNNSDDTKGKGKAIISGADHYDELTSGKVVNPKILEAESSHMAGINNRQIRMGIQRSVSHTQGAEMDGERAKKVLCGCCYWEFGLENIVQCLNGHLCCFKCLRKRVEQIIYEGYKAHASLSCADMDGCEESIPLSEIRRALPNYIIEKYEERKVLDAIVEAKLEGLVYCPFCNIPYEVDRCLQVLDCPNTKCLKASCIQCKKLNHLPLLCEEVQKSPGTLRGEVEERMTKAVIRVCNNCGTKLIRIDGTCNKVTCRCGNTMCYVCRQTIFPSYDHFCDCADRRDDRRVEPGKPCETCNMCILMEQLEGDIEAMDAKEEALKELAVKEPKLLDLEIGPPLEEARLQEEFSLDIDSNGNVVITGVFDQYGSNRDETRW